MNNFVPAILLSHGPGGLGTLRSLARRGVNVTVIAYEATDPLLHSRYSRNKFLALGDDEQQKEANILQVLHEFPDAGAVLLATSDRLVSLISRNEDQLKKKFRFSLPSKKIVGALNDKVQETALIKSLGFAVPKTIQVLPLDPRALAQELRFPIIFKPRSFAVRSLFPKKNEIVSNGHELADFYERWKHALPELLAQEVVPGPDDNSWVCSGTFDRNSDLLDCLVRQKIRTAPPHFGTSTYSVSRVNDEVLELARDLGKKLEYVGHAGIEYRWDERDGIFRYIEMNPRIGGEIGFDEACGLPTVWNSYKVSLGEKIAHSGSRQIEGIYFLNALGDILSMREDGVSLPRIFLIHIALLFKRTSGLWFRWNDPMPGVVVAYRFAVKVCRVILRF